jgi:ABC-type spermidine/putrescine transport system permease subunit II
VTGPGGPGPARSPRGPHGGFDRPRFLWAATGLVYLFLYAPIAVVVLFSFNGIKSLQVLDGFSFRWYETFWNDEELRESLIA